MGMGLLTDYLGWKYTVGRQVRFLFLLLLGLVFSFHARKLCES